MTAEVGDRPDPGDALVPGSLPTPPKALFSGGRQEAAGAAELARLGANPALDRLTELAARLLGAASSQVSLLTDVQTIAAGAGLPPGTIGSTGPLEDSLCTVTVTRGAPLVVENAPSDPRVHGLPPVTSGAVGSYLGVPLVTQSGRTVGALCVFDQESRQWQEGDVRLLQQLAEPVIAELELAALHRDYQADRVVWQLAIDAAGVGAFDWDLVTDELRWDDRLLEIFGLSRDEFGGTIDAFNEVVHPDDRARVGQALTEAIEHNTELVTEYRIVRRDGQVRWISARGRALVDGHGTPVRLLGAAYDTTAVQEGEARLTRLLESMPTAFLNVDRDWRLTYVNADAERLLGRPREDLLGTGLWEVFRSGSDTDFERRLRRAVEQDEPVSFDTFTATPSPAWYQIRAWPSAEGLSVYLLDVTNERAARAQAERVARRDALMSRAGARLAAALDVDETVHELAQVVVPDLGDWCVVSLVDEPVFGVDWRRRVRDVAWRHAEEARLEELTAFARTRIPALTTESPLARVVGEGRTRVISDVEGWIRTAMDDAEVQDRARGLQAGAVVMVPLWGRQRVIGVLTVARSSRWSHFDAETLSLLDDLASRAGLALDNARLFSQQRELAEGLQRELLSRPAPAPHLDVAVRYEPASEAAKVGGDWYDCFPFVDGTTALVIGDVVGHDVAAAAAMGHVRSKLRAASVLVGSVPSQVLRGVDRILNTLRVDTTATALVARLGPLVGDEVSMCWSNAGHPPPLVLRADGTVEVRASEADGLLLGLDPETDRVECTMPLHRGDTVVLYTDGLVEQRGEDLDMSLDRLTATVTDLARELDWAANPDIPLDDLCDALLQRMVPGARDDDIALVALRVRP